MYEYDVYNIHTKERDILFGYDFKDACRRVGYNPEDWNYWHCIYVD